MWFMELVVFITLQSIREQKQKEVLCQFEGNNADSTVTTEVVVGMSGRLLQDRLTNALSTLRTDIVTIIERKN